jgi:hypothetical protein
MTRHFSRLLMAFAAIVCFVCPAQSEPNITQAVSQDCRWDYHNFCSDYGSEAHFSTTAFGGMAPSCPGLASMR